MKSDEKLKKSLTNAYSDLTPDVYDKIINSSRVKYSTMEEAMEYQDDERETIKEFMDSGRAGKYTRREIKKIKHGIIGAAMAAVLAIAILSSVLIKPQEYSYIYVEADSSIEILVNSDRQVVSCKAYDKDGKSNSIIDSDEVRTALSEKRDVESVIRAIVSNMTKDKETGENKPILISSINANIVGEEFLEQSINKSSSQFGRVVYMNIKGVEGAKRLASEYGISPGRAGYIVKVAEHSNFKKEEIVKGTIDELVSIEDANASKTVSAENVSTKENTNEFKNKETKYIAVGNKTEKETEKVTIKVTEKVTKNPTKKPVSHAAETTTVKEEAGEITTIAETTVANSKSINGEKYKKAKIKKRKAKKSLKKKIVIKVKYNKELNRVTINVKNNSNSQVSFSAFRIEKNVGGKWIPVPPKDERAVPTQIVAVDGLSATSWECLLSNYDMTEGLYCVKYTISTANGNNKGLIINKRVRFAIN